MQWPTFACQIAHCPAWLTVGTSPCGVALGGSRGRARAEDGAGGRSAFLAAKGPSCQAGLCQPAAPALDTSLELICLAVGSVCKLHRPFAAPLRPLAWPSKGSQAKAEWQAVSSATHGVTQSGAPSWNTRAQPTHTHIYINIIYMHTQAHRHTRGSHRRMTLNDARVHLWTNLHLRIDCLRVG